MGSVAYEDELWSQIFVRPLMTDLNAHVLPGTLALLKVLNAHVLPGTLALLKFRASAIYWTDSSLRRACQVSDHPWHE